MRRKVNKYVVGIDFGKDGIQLYGYVPFVRINPLNLNDAKKRIKENFDLAPDVTIYELVPTRKVKK